MFQKADLIRLATLAMPFGKYQGRVLIDLPEAYLLWFAQKGFPQGQLGGLLQLALELKTNGLEYLIEPLKEKSSGRSAATSFATMTIENFLHQLENAPDTIEFQQVIDLIGRN